MVLDCNGAYQRNDFKEPRLLHLPIHSKVLNLLTWDTWFLTVIFQCSDSWFLLQKLPCVLAPPLSLWNSSEWSDRLSSRLKSLVGQIKHNSLLLSCAFLVFFFFFSRHMYSFYPPPRWSALLWKQLFRWGQNKWKYFSPFLFPLEWNPKTTLRSVQN